MKKTLKKLVLVLLFCAVTATVFAQEEPAADGRAEATSSGKKVKTLISGAFIWYPAFEFPNKALGEYLTEQELNYNVAGEVQMGLTLWKNFKFLFNVNFSGVDFEDNPLGFLSVISGTLGFKRALMGFKTQNISGSLLWGGEPGTGPVDRTGFGIHITMVELQYDITGFFTYVVEHGWGGLYLGLLYFGYEGLNAFKPDFTPYHYDPKSVFNGFGFSVGIDTLNGYLQYGYRLPELSFGKRKQFTLIPWIHADLGWAWGPVKKSTEAINRVKNNEDIPPSIKAGVGSSETVMMSVMNGTGGAGLLYKTKLTDITFSAGYNFMVLLGFSGQQNNQGLIFKTTFTF